MRTQALLKLALVVAVLVAVLLSACASPSGGATSAPSPVAPTIPPTLAATATVAATSTVVPSSAPTSIPTPLAYEDMIHPFDYDQAPPLDIKEISVKDQDGVAVHDITYASVITKARVLAYVVMPPGKGPFAGIVFMHWLGNTNGNRKEFLDEAVMLAKIGSASILIEGRFPWLIVPHDVATDQTELIEQVVDLRRAFDVLLAQPGVDPRRIGYVGHDFGAMYGSILSGVDKRAKTYVLMAGTTSFNTWFLQYWSPATGAAERQAYAQVMSVFDPVRYVNHAAPAALLFQFANQDSFIPKDVASQFFAAASEPKTIKWYDTLHQLNDEARNDRDQWLIGQLGLKGAN